MKFYNPLFIQTKHLNNEHSNDEQRKFFNNNKKKFNLKNLIHKQFTVYIDQ